MDREKIISLKKTALNVRRDCIETQRCVGSGHLGGALSAVEMMVYLYFERMHIDPCNPLNVNRDIFILSKGHASIGYYSVLARRGFFPLDELKTYRRINSRLQGHSHIDDAPGIECSTGSLGQGLSFGLGLALGFKRKGLNNKVYVMLGDGEMEEGQVWEALMLQGHLKLNNLIAIIDNNKLQLDDFTCNITYAAGLKESLKSFGYNAIEINGHDFEEIDNAFSMLDPQRANVIISDTIKGKGISFMENSIPWHSKKMNDDEYKAAMDELSHKEAILYE